MAAGIATLEQLRQPGFYERLEEKSQRLSEGLKQAAEKAGVKAAFNRVGSMMGMFFADRPVCNFSDAKTSDLKLFSAYYKAMLEKGIYLAPSQFEALFVSSAHSDEAVDTTITAAASVLAGF